MYTWVCLYRVSEFGICGMDRIVIGTTQEIIITTEAVREAPVALADREVSAAEASAVVQAAAEAEASVVALAAEEALVEAASAAVAAVAADKWN